MIRRSPFSMASLPYFVKKRCVCLVFCPELAPMTHMGSFFPLGIRLGVVDWEELVTESFVIDGGKAFPAGEDGDLGGISC